MFNRSSCRSYYGAVGAPFMVNWMKAVAVRAEGSGDVTACTVCLDSSGLNRTWKTIQFKAVRVRELKERKINTSCSSQMPSWTTVCDKSTGGQNEGENMLTMFKNLFWLEKIWIVKVPMLFLSHPSSQVGECNLISAWVIFNYRWCLLWALISDYFEACC